MGCSCARTETKMNPKSKNFVRLPVTNELGYQCIEMVIRSSQISSRALVFVFVFVSVFVLEHEKAISVSFERHSKNPSKNTSAVRKRA